MNKIPKVTFGSKQYWGFFCRVLPVGGIKEKILAAKRAGVHTIVISEENRKDVEDIKPIYVEGLEFVYVHDIQDVIQAIF